MDRKKFLRNCCGIAGAGILFSVIGQSCKTISYIPYTLEDGKMQVRKIDFEERKEALIRTSNLSAPIYIVKLDNGEYSALLLECTHKRCEVRPAGNELQCPCHGSVFSLTGEVLESPAERPLRRFHVTEDDENLYFPYP